MIALAKVEGSDEILIDAIPLEEVVSVRDMNAGSADADSADHKGAKSAGDAYAAPFNALYFFTLQRALTFMKSRLQVFRKTFKRTAITRAI